MPNRLRSLYQFASRRMPSVGRVTLLLCCSVSLSLSACHSHRRQTANSPTHVPVLSASPNPVPAGDLDRPLGTTTISWDTGDGSVGDLYVKVDREPEKFMASAPSGTHEVRWIQFDSFYEFRLYAKKRSKLLAKVAVTRDN
jgi:hypothetical protein